MSRGERLLRCRLTREAGARVPPHGRNGTQSCRASRVTTAGESVDFPQNETTVESSVREDEPLVLPGEPA